MSIQMYITYKCVFICLYRSESNKVYVRSFMHLFSKSNGLEAETDVLLHFSQLHLHNGGAAKKDHFVFSTDFS